ncbi:T9SS type A sorting domain-containing protein [Kaistella flava (ex Peng et al. 2021)]|uniref:T9SS type A sorting domain-containing protein n=1 Tax=Kaistella flava (ex Peng et al. 2021) TaxID=2038776 RepID=A0A7M2YAA9_9FLAO|nr:YDG domain-containing protein [Kaistella flava (ex Peng et al. 2021)]QOW10575.1 T9SS type A sorting domain-containing protein [Kaistella flava (ex Peng et al. 2021)]
MKPFLSSFKTTIFSFLFLFITTAGWAQTTIFSENMGEGTETKTISIAANEFQNSRTLTYSGNADTRVTAPSNTYAGFSAGRNVLITNAINTNFEIAGINTLSYSSLSLSFGISTNKANDNGADLKLEVSSDGISYSTLAFGLSAVKANVWQYVTATGSIPIPSAANLRIRFTQMGTATVYRIDDVKLTDTLVPTIPPVIIGGQTVNGIFGTSLNYHIETRNSPTSYAFATGALPAGLNLNTTTGVISGTPTAAGTFSATVTATNGKGTSSAAAINFTIAKANQTINFAALATKQYGDNDFKLTGVSDSGLSIIYTSSNPAVATVSDNLVTVVGAGTAIITASQTGDNDYNAATEVSHSLTVTAKVLTITGLAGVNKIYDGTTLAAVTGAATLSGTLESDFGKVNLSGTPAYNFSTANVGNGIIITVTGFSLSGLAATNYSLTPPVNIKARITERTVTITGVSANNKIQDGTTTATLFGTPVIVGLADADQSIITITGSPTATFANANVGTGIVVTVTGYTLSGTTAANYKVSQPTGLKADILGLTAPSATAASTVTETSFNANWDTVVGAASGYLLDVSTLPTFGTSAPNIVTETFDSGLTADFYTGSLVLSTGTWNVTKVARSTTGVHSGTYSAELQNSGNSALISPSFDNGISSLSFWVSSSNSGDLQVNYSIDGGKSWIATTYSPYKALETGVIQKTVTVNTTVPTIVQFKRLKDIIHIDDVVINTYNFTPSLVTDYDAKLISGQPSTTSQVTGLTRDTQYYYRLRAKNGTAVSANSNPISVKTLLNEITTYNGTNWDNDEPNVNVKAVINGDFTTTTPLVSKSLTINTGKTLTIAPNTSFTTGDFANNGSLIVASDGNFVQTVGSTNSGSGIFKVDRIANMKRLDYTYWGSPVSGQNLFTFSPKTVLSRFLTYNESNDEFASVTSPKDTPFAAGKGYAIRADNTYRPWTDAASAEYTDFNGTFTGAPNNGDITYPLEKKREGFNLVGNPYSSNIDFDALVAIGAVEGTAYFWTNVNVNEQGTTYVADNYATYVVLSGGTAAANGIKKPTRYIKVGQGFIVQALAAVPLTFTNSMRNDGTGESKFINKGTSNDAIDRFWLKLTTPAQNFNTILIAYPKGATNGFESSADAQQFGESSDAFYSVLNDYKLNIQGRQFPLLTSDIVPLGMKGFETGNYKIAIVEKEGIFADGQNIYLKDKQTNTVTNLSKGDYTFTANEGLTDGRFEIVYQSDLVLGTTNINKDQLVVYRSGSEFVVKSLNKNISTIEVYDASGRLVLQLNPNKTEIRIDVASMVNGIYVLKINRNGEVTTKKITK